MSDLLNPIVAGSVCWAGAIAWWDWRERRVPNALLAGMLTAIAMFLLFLGRAPFGASVAQSVTGFAVGLAVLAPFYLARVMGAGDIKLFAVAGALFGLAALMPIWLIASSLAGVHALVWLIWRWTRSTGLPTLEQAMGLPVASSAASPSLLGQFRHMTNEEGNPQPQAPLTASEAAALARSGASLPYGVHLVIAMACVAWNPEWVQAMTPSMNW